MEKSLGGNAMVATRKREFVDQKPSEALRALERCLRPRRAELVQQSPDSERLGDAPRLGVAATLFMRKVAIDYLGNLPEAAFRQESIHA